LRKKICNRTCVIKLPTDGGVFSVEILVKTLCYNVRLTYRCAGALSFAKYLACHNNLKNTIKGIRILKSLNISLQGTEVTILEAEDKVLRAVSSLGKKSEIQKLWKFSSI
jgi:hypothetical protein